MPESMEKELTDVYREDEAGWCNWLDKAETTTQMVLGAQFSEAEKRLASYHHRTLLPFNRMLRQVNLMSGYEHKNRHSLKIGPVGQEDDLAASQHTAIISNQMHEAQGYDYLSAAFKWGTLVSGSNLLELWRDRLGNLQFHRRGYCGFLLDPMLSKVDLSDCGHILTGQWLRESAVKTLLPEKADKIPKASGTIGHPRWPRMPNRPDGTSNPNPSRLYEEYWKQETSFKSFVIDRMTGEEMLWRDFVVKYFYGDIRKANYVAANMQANNGAPLLSKFKRPVKKVKLAVFVDTNMIWQGDNPLGFDDYPFVWLNGDWIPEVDRDDLKLQSFADVLVNPQKARNKRLNQVCDILEAQITSLRVVKQGALVKEDEAYRSGPTVVRIKENFTGQLTDAFAQVAGPGVPGGMFELLNVLDKEDIHAGGLNEEIFGSDDNEIPGVLHRYRTGQALTGQQGMFASYRHAKRRLGRLMVQFNQANLGPQRASRMLNQQPSQDFYKPDLVRYDCTPTEGLLTSDQQQLWYAELKELASMYPNLIPAAEVVRAAPVAYPDRLLEMIKSSEESAKKQAELQMQNQEMMNKLVTAQAEADLAAAHQDIAQADEARAGAMLDRVKSAVEAGKIQDDTYLGVLDRAIKIGEIQAKMQTDRTSKSQGGKK